MVPPEQGGQLESAILEVGELFEEGGPSFFVHGAVPDDVVMVVVLKGARAVYGSSRDVESVIVFARVSVAC